jgi:hypothetical protein
MSERSQDWDGAPSEEREGVKKPRSEDFEGQGLRGLKRDDDDDVEEQGLRGVRRDDQSEET